MIKDKTSYRILVMEDNPGDLVIVEDFLVEQFFNPIITNASSFQQGSSILSNPALLFDIILLDLTLPDKNGIDLVTEMLRIASTCPIIILTGYADIDFSIRSISQGISDYLLKDDLNATSLHKSIIYAIERKNITSKLIASEKRYSDLFNLSPQPMWVYDSETYRFAQVNSATKSMYGYSDEEFKIMTIMDVKKEIGTSQTKPDLEKITINEGLLKSTVLHHKKSGEIIELEIYSTPITIDNKQFISVIAIDVTEKKLFEHKIIKAIIKTQEEERYEIGGELHDNVCQILAASQLSLGLLKNSLLTTGIQMFEQCRDNISLALVEIRNLSHRLAPVFFDNSTMEEAFERLFNTFNLEHKLSLSLNFDKTIKIYPVSLELELNLYRILQEQFRNIQKHAAASNIEVDVFRFNKMLLMRISDDGIGFNTEATRKGIGLANMKRRAELFSGKFEINSSPGNGCEILINIPLEELN
jgi:PAS domain S-box-containing protein